jgi:hypothetical protein
MKIQFNKEMLVRILLSVNTGKINYMEIGRRRGMIANEHPRIGSNSYEKIKNL